MTLINPVTKINKNSEKNFDDKPKALAVIDDKPKALAVIEENIPHELKEFDQWVTWMIVPIPGKRKFKKVPKNPHNGRNAKSNNPRTWSNYDTALQAYKSGKYDGIGFVTTKDDPFLFWDLDEAYDSRYKMIESGFQDVVVDLSSYTEISPSGSGLRIIVKGQKPIARSKAGWIEIYDDKRFLTITGHSIISGIREKQSEINELFEIIFETTQQNKLPQISQIQPFSLTDDQILEKAFKSANGEKIRRLYAGDTSDYGGDRSSADQAFCCHLAFWCHKDVFQIDRIFRSSALMRPKWDEVHSGDGRTYGQMTIGQAVQLVGSIYDPNHYLPAVGGQVITDFYPRTDTGNGERFAEQHKENVRYCHQWKKWLIWDGKRWKIDTSGRIKLLAKETVRKMYSDASKISKDSQRQNLAGWARTSEKEERKRALLSSAQSELGIPISPDDLDRNSWLLNLQNGTFNLKPDDFRAHNQNDLITKICPVRYDPLATAPIWDKFLDTIFCHDQGLIEFAQQAVGYSLTGDISEQCIFFCYGTGANGKSTFLETIATLLGDYSMHTDFTTFLSNSNKSIRNDLARLKGARFVCAIEAEKGSKFSETILKQISGGEKITVRFLHQEYFEYHPEYKIFLAANHLPSIEGRDEAIWRRIHLIPFEKVIPKKDQDKYLLKKLKKELPGILNWAFEGCANWRNNGLKPPAAVKNATYAYRENMDHILEYFNDCLIFGAQETVAQPLLYPDYRKWCANKGIINPLGKIQFNNQVEAFGYSVKDMRVAGDKGRFWVGIGLKNKEDNLDPGTDLEPNRS